MGRTCIGIEGTRFTIDGEPTYSGRAQVEGLLFNVRTVQATFDDTLGVRSYWDDDGSYPENGHTGYGPWKSPESAYANTQRFIDALPEYRDHGILAVNLNFQGGHPLLCKPWIEEGHGSAGAPVNGQRDFLHNSGFQSDGGIDPDYEERISSVIEACDQLGIVVILQCFYFGQDTIFPGEAEICRAVDNTVDFVCRSRFTNVLLEIANEIVGGHYHHEILEIGRVRELIARARTRASEQHGATLLTSTSEAGLQRWPLESVDAVYADADFVLLHGPGELDEQADPDAHIDQPRTKLEMIRSRPWYRERPRPIIFNESAGRAPFEYAVEQGVSWGLHSSEYFQTVWPPKWGVWENGISWYFDRVKELTR